MPPPTLLTCPTPPTHPAGETRSEGGFLPNKVAAASVLDVSEATDKKGRKYYRYQVLARSADDNEGGRHNLIAATVADNKLYLCKVQIGDKRWIKVRGERAAQGCYWYRWGSRSFRRSLPCQVCVLAARASMSPVE